MRQPPVRWRGDPPSPGHDRRPWLPASASFLSVGSRCVVCIYGQLQLKTKCDRDYIFGRRTYAERRSDALVPAPFERENGRRRGWRGRHAPGAGGYKGGDRRVPLFERSQCRPGGERGVFTDAFLNVQVHVSDEICVIKITRPP